MHQQSTGVLQGGQTTPTCRLTRLQTTILLPRLADNNTFLAVTQFRTDNLYSDLRLLLTFWCIFARDCSSAGLVFRRSCIMVCLYCGLVACHSLSGWHSTFVLPVALTHHMSLVHTSHMAGLRMRPTLCSSCVVTGFARWPMQRSLHAWGQHSSQNNLRQRPVTCQSSIIDLSRTLAPLVEGCQRSKRVSQFKINDQHVPAKVRDSHMTCHTGS